MIVVVVHHAWLLNVVLGDSFSLVPLRMKYVKLVCKHCGVAESPQSSMSAWLVKKQCSSVCGGMGVCMGLQRGSLSLTTCFCLSLPPSFPPSVCLSVCPSRRRRCQSQRLTQMSCWSCQTWSRDPDCRLVHYRQVALGGAQLRHQHSVVSQPCPSFTPEHRDIQSDKSRVIVIQYEIRYYFSNLFLHTFVLSHIKQSH